MKISTNKILHYDSRGRNYELNTSLVLFFLYCRQTAKRHTCPPRLFNSAPEKQWRKTAFYNKHLNSYWEPIILVEHNTDHSLISWRQQIYSYITLQLFIFRYKHTNLLDESHSPKYDLNNYSMQYHTLFNVLMITTGHPNN